MIEAGTGALAGAGRDASRAVLAAFAALLLVMIAAGWPSVAGLAELWSHPERRTYQHGYLMAAIVLWLVYRERHRIAAHAGAPSWPLLAATGAASLAWAVAWNAGLQAVHFLIWPAILWMGATGLLGTRAGRALLRPLAFFAFALPVWDALTPALQAATVYANEGLAMLLGMPVIIEDTLIHIPEGSFEIAGGCAGLNYLVVGLAIAALLGELNRDTPKRRLLLVAVSGGLALVSNWLRVFIIIYAGHVSDMTHYLVRVDHYRWGWVLYSFVLLAFFLVARRLPPSRPAARAQHEPAGHWHFRPLPLFAAAIAMTIGPALTAWPRAAREDPAAVNLTALPARVSSDRGPWESGPATGDWQPVFRDPDSEALVEYSRADRRVTAYVASYQRQGQGRELVGHDSRIQGAPPARRIGGGRRAVAGEPPVAMAEAERQDAFGRRALLWWTYRVGSRHFASGFAAQLWYGVAALWSRPVSGIVILHADCRPDCDAARAGLQDFADEALPGLLAAAGGGES